MCYKNQQTTNFASTNMVADRPTSPKDVLAARIDALDKQLGDLRALYRALPDEMPTQASYALNRVLQNAFNR